MSRRSPARWLKWETHRWREWMKPASECGMHRRICEMRQKAIRCDPPGKWSLNSEDKARFLTDFSNFIPAPVLTFPVSRPLRLRISGISPDEPSIVLHDERPILISSWNVMNGETEWANKAWNTKGCAEPKPQKGTKLSPFDGLKMISESFVMKSGANKREFIAFRRNLTNEAQRETRDYNRLRGLSSELNWSLETLKSNLRKSLRRSIGPFVSFERTEKVIDRSWKTILRNVFSEWS